MGDGCNNLFWWQFGVIGGIALSLATAYKFLQAIPRLVNGIVLWSELAVIAGLTFLMGFVCGCVVWLLQRLLSRFGLIGEVTIGVVTANVYFLLLAAIVDPDLIKLWLARESALTMFGVSTVVGAAGAILVGIDQRGRSKRET